MQAIHKGYIFLTLLVEAENIIPSRTLTKVSTDPDDLANHLLLGHTKTSLFNSNLSPKCLRQDHKLLIFPKYYKLVSYYYKS